MYFDDQNYLLRPDIISNIDFFFFYIRQILPISKIGATISFKWLCLKRCRVHYSVEPYFLNNSRKTLLMSFTLRLYYIIIVLYDVDYFAGKSSIFFSKEKKKKNIEFSPIVVN